MSKASSSVLRIAGCMLVVCSFFVRMNVYGEAATFQRFDTQSSFIAANSSPTIISYDGIASGYLSTYEYIFATEGVKMKPNTGYTVPLYVNDWTNLLPGKEIAIYGKEGMEFNFTTPVNAFGYDFLEPTTCLPPFCPQTFIDSTFTISIYNGTTKLTEYSFMPANDVATFF